MPNSQGYIVSQSAWALDAVENFTTSEIYTSENSNSGAAGELQNDYSQCFGSNLYSASYSLSCSMDGIESYNGTPGAGTPLLFGTRLYNELLDYNDPVINKDFYAQTFGAWAVGNENNGVKNSYTLSAWINPKTFGGGNAATQNGKKYHIISFSSTDHPRPVTPTPGTCAVKLYLTGNLASSTEWFIGAETVISTSFGYVTDLVTSSIATCSADTWSHVLCCYDAFSPGDQSEMTDRYKIYIDGTLITLDTGTFNYTGSESPFYGEINASTGAIGNDVSYNTDIGTLTGSIPSTPSALVDEFFVNNVFNGEISEVTFFPYSMYTQIPILIPLMYNGGCPPDMYTATTYLYPQLWPVGWYRMGETLPSPGPYYSSGLRQDGPADTAGSSSWDPDQPIPTGARLNNAMNFYYPGGGIPSDYRPPATLYAFGDGYPVKDLSISAPINVYMEFTQSAPCPTGIEVSDKSTLISAPIYNRKHSLPAVFSTTHFGWSFPKSTFPASADYEDRTLTMPIPETSASIASWRNQYPLTSIISTSSLFTLRYPLGKIQTCGGSAEWEAGRLSGYVKAGEWISSSNTPFYNTYGKYNETMRLANQKYSVIPEFIISEKINFYYNKQNKDFLAPPPFQFSIQGTSTGSTSNTPSNSSEPGFYEIFSNSDFLRNFSVIKQDHKGFADPSTISLKCNALMKFLPYDGFFPSERSLQIANQFSKSYGRYVQYDGLEAGLTNVKFRPFLTPFFRPGIIYNTIKSGLAVDFPIYTSSYQTINYKTYQSDPDAGNTKAYSNYYALGTQNAYSDGLTKYSASWDYRVPFEAVVEPEKYLSGVKIYDLEPNPSSTIDIQATWGGEGDELYKLQMHNYLAAIPEFFLPDGEFTSLKSQSQRNFLTVQSGTSYGMRVKVRTTMNKERIWRSYVETGSIIDYEIPQHPRVLTGESKDLRETFTMYSRASAFGPPVASTTYLGFNNIIQPNNLTNVDYNISLYPPCLMGVNPSFTPPYYGGESWADIVWKAGASGEVTLDEIFSEATVNLWRIDTNPVLKSGLGPGSFLLGTPRMQAIWSPLEIPDWQDYSTPMRTSYANAYAMQIDSSFNILGLDGDRWVIEPKFETPHYNFNSETSIRPISSASNTLTIPTNGSESLPRGMWHQFGTMETDKGVYLEVGAIPEDWRTTRGYANPNRTTTELAIPFVYQTEELSGIDLSVYQNDKFEDLSKVVGFEESKKLGNTAKELTVSEAIIAVPFTIEDGEKRFFEIPENTIRKALGKLNSLASDKSVSQSSLAVRASSAALDTTLNELLDNEDDRKIARREAAATAAATAAANQIERDEDEANTISETIKDMVNKMKKYVLPPRMDFVRNLGEVTPFAMYIFEFDYTFTQEDLSYMWQNVTPPTRSEQFVEQEATISHKLFSNELMGSFGNGENDPIKDGLQWMVFKVKQRANNNYFSKVSKENGTKTEQFKYSYNWPYDFFSIVEFACLGAKIGFGQGLQDGGIDQSVFEIKQNPGIVSKGPESSPPSPSIIGKIKK